ELRSAPQSSPDLVLERRRTMPMNLAKFLRRLFSPVCRRPVRERVIHVLALKNCKETELLARLQREGLVEKDKETLGRILHEVASLDPKNKSFSLKEDFFKYIQEDWPGYSEMEKQALEVMLSKKSAPSQNATSTSQTSSLRSSGRDIPLR
ncbi:ELL2 factor, partial [Dasyornis broadbenti]|nr:ELL2 factor [Dasyornis broadbenti]